MKRKGFTLVELLVVISIIALLMAILMPALAKVKQLAHRMVCGTNLSGIGKSMIMYSTDNHEEYPIAGDRIPQPTWGTTAAWQAQFRPDVWTSTASITSCFYLLIKYADAQPKQFVCKGDVGSMIFKLSEVIPMPVITDITEAWDFGPVGRVRPGKYCSYSYHNPFWYGGVNYAVSTVTNPGCAIAADRNPFFDENAQVYIEDTSLQDPSLNPEDSSYLDPDKKSSCAAHQRDGQNVLFNDSHVKFERFPDCGVNNDNIWRNWGPNVKVPTVLQQKVGVPAMLAPQAPYDPAWRTWAEEDSLLINETTYASP
jgi:prepilin-type N-terminal cleavage/methylation domain-containing protein